MMSKKLNTIKLTFAFILLSILNAIFSNLTFKTNRNLADVFLLIGTGFLFIGIFFAIFMVISLFKESQNQLLKSDLKSSYNKNVNNPLILQLKISLILSYTGLSYSGLVSTYIVWILHITDITSIDLIISFTLSFLLEIMTAILILPRVGLFRETRPGEIRIIKLHDFQGGITMGVLTLSRHSPFKSIIFIGDEDNSITRTIEAHELGHATEHHPIFLELSIIFLLSIIEPLIWYVSFGYTMHRVVISIFLVIKTVLIILSVLVAILLFLRVAESRADAFAYKVIGKSAYENLVEALRRVYGENIKSTEDAPLWSKVTHTSSRNAIKTGDPLSSIGIWEFPVVLSFIASTIGITRFNSIYIIYPLLFVGTLVISFLIGLVFLPIVRKYYRMTERGSLNFSFLLAGIYMISSIIALDAYPNLYLVIFSLLIGIILAFIITKAFLDLHNSTKVVVATLLIYLSINILISLIKILPHGG